MSSTIVTRQIIKHVNDVPDSKALSETSKGTTTNFVLYQSYCGEVRTII